MKKKSRILHWLTLLVASIGVCAFLSVCFILIYSEIFGGFSPKKKDVTLPIDIAEAAIDDHNIISEKSDNMPPASYQEDVPSDTHTNKTIKSTQDKDMNEDWTFEEPDIAKSSVSEDVGEYEIPVENTVDVMPVDSGQPIIPASQEGSSGEITYIPESSSQDNTVEPAAKPADASGNNNFNTYDNEAQQQVDDLYVLNTSSMKIHYKTCDSVKKIAPQNYSTSNDSVEELIEQGYSRCGICFK